MNGVLRKNSLLTAVAVVTVYIVGLGPGSLSGADRPIQRNRGDAFQGLKAGAETNVAGVRFCWCPAGRFMMGSPPNEPERRPGEEQVIVTLTKGFWIAKFETTQGQWKRVMEKLPAPPT